MNKSDSNHASLFRPWHRSKRARRNLVKLYEACCIHSHAAVNSKHQHFSKISPVSAWRFFIWTWRCDRKCSAILTAPLPLAMLTVTRQSLQTMTPSEDVDSSKSLFYVVAAKLSFSSHFARAKFLLTRHRNASCEHAKVSVSRLSTLDPHCRGCLKLFSLARACEREQTNHTHPILRVAAIHSNEIS